MVMRGAVQPLTVSFYDEPEGDLEDPTDIQLEIRFNDEIVHTADPDDIEQTDVGRYSYEWTVPLDADAGQHVAVWSAILPEQILRSYGYSNFTVNAADPGIPGFSGCVWPVDDSCLDTTWAGYDAATQERAIGLASATLSRLTAYRVGDCPIKVRPQPQNGVCGLSGVFHPMNWAGTWTNNGTQTYQPRDLELPAPIMRLDEIIIDGVEQDLGDFIVYSRKVITYVGADDDFAWPRTQNMGKPDSEEGTFSVTYLNTHPVDQQGALAAGVLANEYAKACAGGTEAKKCRLPAGVTNITRNGISIEVVSGAFPEGLTGIREVDGYVALWNVRGRSRPMLFDPGAPKHRIEA